MWLTPPEAWRVSSHDLALQFNSCIFYRHLTAPQLQCIWEPQTLFEKDWLHYPMQRMRNSAKSLQVRPDMRWVLEGFTSLTTIDTPQHAPRICKHLSLYRCVCDISDKGNLVPLVEDDWLGQVANARSALIAYSHAPRLLFRLF